MANLMVYSLWACIMLKYLVNNTMRQNFIININ